MNLISIETVQKRECLKNELLGMYCINCDQKCNSILLYTRSSAGIRFRDFVLDIGALVKQVLKFVRVVQRKRQGIFRLFDAWFGQFDDDTGRKGMHHSYFGKFGEQVKLSSATRELLRQQKTSNLRGMFIGLFF
jgi:hypothetical protein